MQTSDVLLSVALDLTSSIGSTDRYQRLLTAVRTLIPCDAAALLRLEGADLVPVATHGLAPETMGRRFAIGEHPRLAVLTSSREPVRFPPDSPLPDPYDGLLADDPTATHHVHACLGCPLIVGGRLVGLLTADAIDPHAFDTLDPDTLRWVGALAGAVARTSRLVELLEESARRSDRVARDALREAQDRQGGEILGTSAAIGKVRWEVDLVGRADLAVLVTGETGVGKELVARGVHAASPRRDRPLLYVNCAALPETVAESELFGHVRGAFTGADSDRPGKFEVADGGTLFLDEIGELPLGVQPKLLRVLQSGEVQRVGADRTFGVDVRIIAATNRDLDREVAAGRFRADLFHRLNVYPIRVPPLRERREDVPLLAGHFCEAARRRLGLGPVRLDAAARDALTRHPWPGNVRELENVLYRSVLKAAAGVRHGGAVIVGVAHLGAEFGDAGDGAGRGRRAGGAGAGVRFGVTTRNAGLGAGSPAARGGRTNASPDGGTPALPGSHPVPRGGSPADDGGGEDDLQYDVGPDCRPSADVVNCDQRDAYGALRGALPRGSPDDLRRRQPGDTEGEPPLNSPADSLRGRLGEPSGSSPEDWMRGRPGEPPGDAGGHAPGESAADRESSEPWPPHLGDAVDEFQRRAILRAVAARDGNWAAAARDLGLHRANLLRLARRLGVKDRPGFRRPNPAANS